jgi:hypothetical protein
MKAEVSITLTCTKDMKAEVSITLTYTKEAKITFADL